MNNTKQVARLRKLCSDYGATLDYKSPKMPLRTTCVIEWPDNMFLTHEPDFESIIIWGVHDCCNTSEHEWTEQLFNDVREDLEQLTTRD